MKAFRSFLTATFLSPLLALSSLAAEPVIYDTDMAIDDWTALLYLAKHPEVDIKAVTVSCSGETRCKPGVENVISLLELADNTQPIPVAHGDAYPLDGYFVFPVEWRDDSDTLSGVPIDKPSYKPSNKHAADVIHDIVNASKEPVTLIAVGPLTNVHQWLERYPQDKPKLGRLVIMGGSLDAKGNIEVPLFTKGHPNKKAEWNLFVDPVATEFVFKSGLPIEMVGLDVTNKVKVTAEYVANFKKLVNNPTAKFVDQVYDKNDWFIASGEYYFWDVLAALVVTNPELCVAEKTPINVAVDYVEKPVYTKTTDTSMPAKRWDGKPRRHIDESTAAILSRAKSGPKVDVCMKTNAKKALKIFTDTLVSIDKSDSEKKAL
ncbi:nucleoside hydrolase [Marinibactrum halimedae]|uniref:Inosine/uridine-preferring nucleoside hydrolase domain-containing protein n=1 Tax=Marinibactrum halimedae TaxID=1444977 RepID=A0AA37T930_9GAMM|nr:nucleoside hydrolase [Marinibactrum halimedae]MCD9459679.1 nucleoside hydrolase [Marinibactrum halimedae]GLS25705.1 hypothetical protein GCM10007877_14190 [Marinibactrum halimedae]